MLNKAQTLNGFRLHCLDGEIGKVKELYFDDRYWTIRYLIADTGNWLADRQVLISPHALTSVNKEKQSIAVDLSKKQIEDSPTVDRDKPVSRQFEDKYYGHFGWPQYYVGPYMWGAYPYIEHAPKIRRESPQSQKAWNPSLRSTNHVSGYHIQATDGEVGHIEDFVVDDETWAIRYLIVDTRNCWPGKKVLVSPNWIERVSWDRSKVFVNLLRETIKKSPEYTEKSLIERDYEAGLHRHYNRQGYWVEELAVQEHSR